MDIKIDTREKARKDRAKYFYQQKGHNVLTEKLEVGDYIFDEKVVYEYKQISDFVQSINNDSLFNEATNQALQYPHHFVIIEGNIIDYIKKGWSFPKIKQSWKNNYKKYVNTNLNKYYGALRRLRAFTCPILVKNEIEAFNEMLFQSMKCLDGKSKYYSNVSRQIPSQDAVDILLTSAKNISIKKAEAIRKQHSIRNIYDLLQLTEDDFTQVKGIGKTTSSNLYNFLHNGGNT